MEGVVVVVVAMVATAGAVGGQAKRGVYKWCAETSGARGRANWGEWTAMGNE